MRCLYCGKELALLRRLTGAGKFCCDAHKHSYQEEYDRLALGRLLQAQKKGPQAGDPTAQSSPAKPVAEAGEPAAIALKTPESAMAGEPETELKAESGLSAGDEADLLEMAGFLMESPAIAAPPEDTPHLEPWIELSTQPTAAIPAVDLPAGSAIAMEVAPSSVATVTDGSLVQAVEFRSEVLFGSSRLLELSQTAIDSGAEDPEAIVPVIEETRPALPEIYRPGPVRELFEMPVKTFRPVKPALIGGDALPSEPVPRLPNMQSLPLRPKVALAPEYIPPFAVVAPRSEQAGAPNPEANGSQKSR